MLTFALTFALFALRPAAPVTAAEGATYTVECTFSNPGYTGPCAVSEIVPAARKPLAACRAILSCLNASGCTKTYCNASEVRGGWKLLGARRASEQKPQ